MIRPAGFTIRIEATIQDGELDFRSFQRRPESAADWYRQRDAMIRIRDELDRQIAAGPTACPRAPRR